MATVLPGSRIGDEVCRQVSQFQSVVEFAMEQQAAVGTDGRTPERELDASVECEPQSIGFRFTRRVRYQVPDPPSLTF